MSDESDPVELTIRTLVDKVQMTLPLLRISQVIELSWSGKRGVGTVVGSFPQVPHRPDSSIDLFRFLGSRALTTCRPDILFRRVLVLRTQSHSHPYCFLRFMKLSSIPAGFIIVVLLLVLCAALDTFRSLDAQESTKASPIGVVIEHLSTDAVLSEEGADWQVRVRFTTSAPSICHVTSGPSAAALHEGAPELEGLRNHRFTVAAVPGKPWFVQIHGTAGEQKVSSEVIEVAPPEPFPGGSISRMEIPLSVTETAGVARHEPVTFGLPIPQGALGDVDAIVLFDGKKSIPTQSRALVRWPDRSVKWLLVSGRVELTSDQTKNLTLAFGGDIQASKQSATSMVSENGDALSVDTGLTRLVIDRKTGAGTIQTNDGLLTQLPHSRLTNTDGRVFSGKVESIEVEESGPQRVVILTRGHHFNEAGEPWFGFELRYFLHAGDAFVRVDHILQHDIVSAEMKYGDEMKSFRSLDLVFPTEADGVRVALDGGKSASLAAGERLFQQESDAFSLASDGKGVRAPGVASSGKLTVAIRDFWQQWPKAISAEKGALALGLYPTISPGDRYANRPDEHILYFYLREGNYTFRSGFEKRHELFVGPTEAGGDFEKLHGRVNHPLLVKALPDWYLGSGALPGLTARDASDFPAYDKMLREDAEGYLEMREENKWYGLMNFGDWWGERTNNWGNIEYDLQNAMITQYFRTGDPLYFDIAEDAARHNADVDVVHFAAGQNAGPGKARRVGQAWVHSMGHTGGYYPHDYMDMSIYAQGYAENEGHMWNQGNLAYWLLTGDEQVHRSALQLGDWLAGPDTIHFSYGNARVPGWMGIIAMSSYFATEDPYYLNAMHLIYEEVQAKADPKAGLWVHRLSSGHCNCEKPHYGEAGFMAGVLMTSLKYYYLATGDDEIAQRIVHIANWLVENLYDPKVGNFRYTSCPETSIASTSPLIMANGLAFAANHSGDKNLMRVTKETFLRGMITSASSARGKSLAYTTCSAPFALDEMAHFPGPTLEAEYGRNVGAILDPVRARLPSIVPNPDFEKNVEGWVTRPGLKLTHSTEVRHSGSGAAKISGHSDGQNEYIVTHYTTGPPWEILTLKPGKTMRLQLWLRVDAITEGAPAPLATIATRSKGRTQHSFAASPYDLKRQGEWQLLQTEFTVPEGTDAAYIAIATRTKSAVDATLYLDDVNLVPVDETPSRDTYLWSLVEAKDAKTSGAVQLIDEDLLDGWKVLATDKDKTAGTATFTIPVPDAASFPIRLRARNPDNASDEAGSGLPLQISIAGGEPIKLDVASSTWKWIALPQEVLLKAGNQEVEIRFPENSGVQVHSALIGGLPLETTSRKSLPKPETAK